LLRGIAIAQESLRKNPANYKLWAELALGYVRQATSTNDPSFYAKAEGAAQRSLELDTKNNFLGYAALAAVRNGRHDFRGALRAADSGLKIASFNATLYGARGDALTQLGRYAEATAAIERMNQLQPGLPAFTRASYVLELRGDVAGARAALERSLELAASPADKAFVQQFLGELAIRYGGGAQKALEHYDAGLKAQPGYPPLLAARGKANAALGRIEAAKADYTRAGAALPTPGLVLEYANFLESLRDPAAAAQYELFGVQAKLYEAAGVALEVEGTLFEAERGDPKKALELAAEGWRIRPFVEMADAYAWAFYANRRYAEALVWSKRAFVSGWRPALALYHRGMIQNALGDKRAARADLSAALKQDPMFDALGAQRAAQVLQTL